MADDGDFEGFKNIIENMSDWVTVIDAKTFEILSCNSSVESLLGISKDEAIGKRCHDLVHCAKEQPEGCPCKVMLETGKSASKELYLPNKDIWVLVTVDPIMNDKNEISYYSHVVKDITHKKKMEEKLQQALEDKETLLAEIHHRVKNNLQIITSLLGLQMRSMDDEIVKQFLSDMQNRVNSMALIHENLYRSMGFKEIPLDEYITTLVDSIISTQETSVAYVRADYDLDKLSVETDTAIHLGLLVNELVTNSIKHAFKEKDIGKITVGLKQQGDSIILTVADDGIGISDEIEPNELQSLGLRLITMLTKQIGGTLETTRKNGTESVVTFQIKKDII